jgi:hypothetical protein
MNLLKSSKSKFYCLSQVNLFKMANSSGCLQMQLLNSWQMIFINRLIVFIWNRDLKLIVCANQILSNTKISSKICNRLMKRDSQIFWKLMIRFWKLESKFKHKKYWSKSYMFNISRKWKLIKKMTEKKRIIFKKKY